MGGLRDLPIRRKLLVTGLTTTACALIVSSAIFLVSTYVFIRRSVHENLRAQAAIVADNTTAAVAFADRSAATETVGALRATPDVDLACVFDQRGQLFAQYARAGAAVVCPANPPADQDTVQSLAVLIVRPIAVGGRRVGTLYVGGTLAEVGARLRLQAYAALGGLAIGALVAVLIAEPLQRFISRPVANLARTATEISRRGDYSLRARREGDDEIGALVSTFNEMVREIERRDDQLRAASRLKDEFLAAVSHELRTPLNAILGWLQILRTAPPPAVSARAIDSLDRNARAQARLIEDLLDVSRIVSGKLHLKTGAVDLVAVVDAALEVARPAADAKGIVIERQVSEPPRLVSGDADRLQQIVWNLLSNAVKFTPAGGRVTVALTTEAGTHRLTVSDTGIGIMPAFLPYVFDRFRQADGSMTRQQGGLGLGLAIVRELVELHGGQVEASSGGQAQGSTFSIRLPQLVEATVAKPAPPRLARDAGLQEMSILVVDDDADSRDVASAALAAAGARIEAVESSAGAIRVVAERAFDVLVCDIAMPDIDGLSLIRQLRDAGIATPAVAVTAYARPDDRARAAAAGFQGFVAKPFDFATLVEAVRRAGSHAAPLEGGHV